MKEYYYCKVLRFHFDFACSLTLPLWPKIFNLSSAHTFNHSNVLDYGLVPETNVVQ